LSIGNDSPREYGPDAGQGIELLRRRRVDVDLAAW